jgi:gluconolactonase
VIYPKGAEAVITDNFEGKAYGRPNDLIVSTRGAIYFTEPGPNAPPAGTPPPATPPLPAAVYYVAPNATRAVKVAEGIERPNGIMLSRDETTLYVNNSNGDFLLAYDIQPDGTLSNRRDFAKYQARGADGLAIDNDGRLYVATGAGVEVVSPTGQHLGVIPVSRAPQNIAFAGKDKKTLYIVGRGAAFKIDLLASGFKGRAK